MQLNKPLNYSGGLIGEEIDIVKVQFFHSVYLDFDPLFVQLCIIFFPPFYWDILLSCNESYFQDLTDSSYKIMLKYHSIQILEMVLLH